MLLPFISIVPLATLDVTAICEASMQIEFLSPTSSNESLSFTRAIVITPPLVSSGL